VISSFHCEVGENFALLGYYAVSDGNFLPMFQDSESVPSNLRVRDPERKQAVPIQSLYNEDCGH